MIYIKQILIIMYLLFNIDSNIYSNSIKPFNIVGAWNFDCITYIENISKKETTVDQGCLFYTFQFNADGTGYIQCDSKKEWYWNFVWEKKDCLFRIMSTDFCDLPFLNSHEAYAKIITEMKDSLKIKLYSIRDENYCIYIILEKK